MIVIMMQLVHIWMAIEGLKVCLQPSKLQQMYILAQVCLFLSLIATNEW